MPPARDERRRRPRVTPAKPPQEPPQDLTLPEVREYMFGLHARIDRLEQREVDLSLEIFKIKYWLVVALGAVGWIAYLYLYHREEFEEHFFGHH